MNVTALRLSLAAVLGGALALSAAPVAAQPVVQALPNPATEQLNEALRRLSRNPASLPALLDAGRASLALDDEDAAEGFFTRAAVIAPDDGRVLLGQAVVAVRQERASESLALFARAQAAGADISPFAADQGLAHDLVGDNARAQALYGQALAREENPETLRRLALSHAIAGDQAASEAILLPLLQRRDLAAYRTRAFALAILGREDEAVSIAETLLPARLSRRMGPYLRFMPRLTRPQQAAAANLGSFPRAADIGRDDVQLARAPVQPRDAGARLVPGGQSLGPAGAVSEDEEIDDLGGDGEFQDGLTQAQQAAAEPATVASDTRLAEVARSQVPAQVPARAQEPAPPQPGLAPGEPVVATAPPPARERAQIDLAQVFADFELEETRGAQPTNPDAVDITRIQPRRESPAPPPPPPPPAEPSRHWVQVATGQDVSAFRFDWRRLVRNSGGLLEGRKPYRAAWNSTNRLLTGPFDSASAAQEFVTALAAEGIDAFRFTSAQGEVVSALE